MRALLLVVFLAACGTDRNPSLCVDGVCVDPSKPYCDDGTLSGLPQTCIPVACTPGELAACRGDTAIVCNASGSNYEETRCDRGCDPSANGCRECVDDTQCSPETPICDHATSGCRGCVADDECPSRVCDLESGSCVAESAIVYATPNQGIGTCTRTSPCSLSTAITQAANAPSSPILRMLPGFYGEPLVVNVPTAKPLKVVGTGATLGVSGSMAAITIDSGANVAVRGIASASAQHVHCGKPNAAFSNLLLQNVELNSVGDAPRVEVTRCKVEIQTATIALGTGGTVGLSDDATLVLDRVHMFTTAVSTLLLSNPARVELRITNSLLEGVRVVHFGSTDTALPGTRLVFAFSTFVVPAPLDLCSGSTYPFRSAIFENSIVAVAGGFDALDTPNPANCSFAGTLLTRQTTPPTGTVVGDPSFVDVAMKNYHLQPTSQAVDTAANASVLPTRDLDGVQRPKGSKPDIGAYER